MKKKLLTLITASFILAAPCLNAGHIKVWSVILTATERIILSNRQSAKCESALFNSLIATSKMFGKNDEWISSNLIPRGQRLSNEDLAQFYAQKKEACIEKPIIITKSDSTTPLIKSVNYPRGSHITLHKSAISGIKNTYVSEVMLSKAIENHPTAVRQYIFSIE